ncbi:chorismate synthase [Lentimicrobium sp. S6]|uniref:chorismate synthase n=1 Tax=Lentimicrobium sp. S6 TaxID=2735872 RepID=UPI00155537B2|nr:chorismate synthase [Lentimicrobium sp. S6]NPD46516.1 chorismate synthase [Lentimicrobium sp. S6]
MNSFGTLYRISIFGESHGPAVGIIIDGCPSGISITEEDFVKDIERRKAGKKGTTPRVEADQPQILSGIFEGKTTGSPITIIFENKNTRSGDYQNIRNSPRPGHADFTAFKKYRGFNDYRGGGHFSGRVTTGLVAAGVIAKKVLAGVNFDAQVIEVGGQADIDAALNKAIANHDSVGGIIECRIQNLDIGIGEPFFDKAEAVLGHALFAIPAVKGMEIGSGFQAARMTGSENNDMIIDKEGTTETNHAGGINGGITNGNEMVIRVAVKPTSSITKGQQTFNLKENKVQNLNVKGRHDACIALRMPVIVEAVSAIALADLHLRHKARK